MNAKAILLGLSVLSICSFSFAEKSSVSKKKLKNTSAASVEKATETATLKTDIKAEENKTINAAISNYAFQPSKDRVALTATSQILTKSISRKFKNSKADTDDFKTHLVAIRGQRGITENTSASVELGIGNQEYDFFSSKTSQSQGMTDLVFGIQQLKNISMGQLFYGAKVAFSPTDKEIAYNWRNGKASDGNMFSGGNTLSPYLGIQMDKVSYITGAQARYNYKFSRTSNFKDSSGEKIILNESGEQSLDLNAFVEKTFKQASIGAHAGLSAIDSLDSEFKSANSRDVYTTDAIRIINAGVYARITPNNSKNFDILPSLTMSKLVGNSGGSLSLEDGQEFNLAVSLRAGL